MRSIKYTVYSCLLLLIVSCATEKKADIEVTRADYHRSINQVIDIMVHDIFSPPVASRIFVYPNIAAYEIIAQEDDRYASIAPEIHGLTPIPPPSAEAHVNLDIAALIAHLEISKKMVFSESVIQSLQDSLYDGWSSTNADQLHDAKAYADQVVAHIWDWVKKDMYNETRSMAKYVAPTNDPSKWVPTPPGYMDGIEPHWRMIRTLVIDSAQQFRPTPPPAFSMKENTAFYKELEEVYDIGKQIIAKGDTAKEVEIARFWDCNPYVTTADGGHYMPVKKKITPGAHWIAIGMIANNNKGADFRTSVAAQTLTSIAIFDGFISCWDEKYNSMLVRPETLINNHIDDDWFPILQTPPFPEYTSGHSVVSAAASTALTHFYGDGFAFDDDTETRYGLPVRSFSSFDEAAEEAAISRMYGGIHYRAAVDNGLTQGRALAKYVLDDIGGHIKG